MKLKTWFIAACVATLAPAALAQSQSDDARRDAKFLRDLAHANMVEVEAGRLAESKARSDAVKNFARQMVASSNRQLDELKRINQRIRTELPEAPDRRHVAAIDRLESASGAEFDRIFMAQMVEDQRTSLRLAEDAARDAHDPQLKAAAQNAIAENRRHLARAERLAASPGGAGYGSSSGADAGDRRDARDRRDTGDRGDAKILRDLAHASMVAAEAGRIGESKARSESVKGFSRQMVTTNSRQLDELKRVNQRIRTELPEAADRRHVRSIDRLESVSGSDFDRVYLRHVVDDHRAALTLAEDAVRDAEDPQLKTAAQHAVTEIRRNLARAERLASTAAAGR